MRYYRLKGFPFSLRLPSGEVPVVNRHLVADLVKLGRWTDSVRQLIRAHGGSIAKVCGGPGALHGFSSWQGASGLCSPQLEDMPDRMKELYRTVWELKQKDLIDMAVSRSMFVDQVRVVLSENLDGKWNP